MLVNLEESEGSGLLPEGWNRVTVKSEKAFTANTGTPGIEYKLENERGRIAASFYLSPKAKHRLKFFAAACLNCPVEAIKLSAFDTASIIDRTVDVLVTRGEKYLEVTEWRAANEDAESPLRQAGPHTEGR